MHNLLEHMPGHVTKYVLVRHVPEHVLGHMLEHLLRHVLEHVTGHVIRHMPKHSVILNLCLHANTLSALHHCLLQPCHSTFERIFKYL